MVVSQFEILPATIYQLGQVTFAMYKILERETLVP